MREDARQRLDDRQALEGFLSRMSAETSSAPFGVIPSSSIRTVDDIFSCIYFLRSYGGLFGGEGGAANVAHDWVFRGQEDVSWPLTAKSRRVEPLDAWNVMLPTRESIADDLWRRIGDSRGFAPPCDDVPAVLLAPPSDELRKSGQCHEYHLLQCKVEHDLVARFARLADSIGLQVLDPPEDFVSARSMAQVLDSAWVPLQSTSLAQHHGIPTKLLDWSRRPEVAAYFASRQINGDSATGEMGVYMLDASILSSECRGGALPIVEVLRERHASHPYLHAQDGLFTWIQEGFSRDFLAATSRWPTLMDALAEEGLGTDRIALWEIRVNRARLGDSLRERIGHLKITKAHLMPTYDNVKATVLEQCQRSWQPWE